MSLDVHITFDTRAEEVEVGYCDVGTSRNQEICKSITVNGQENGLLDYKKVGNCRELKWCMERINKYQKAGLPLNVSLW